MKMDSKHLVAYVAKLAHLQLGDAEREGLAEDMQKIIGYVEQIDQVDVSGVEPTNNVLGLVNVWREDAVEPQLSHEKALENAPSRSERYFKVPRVIGEGA